MAKQPSKKELYDAAIKKDKEDWKPLDALRRLIMPKETAEPVPPMPKPGLPEGPGMKKGGKVGCKCMSKGGSASTRADGCAQRGKTRGKIV